MSFEIKYEITLENDVVIAVTDNPGNEIDTLDYIPGSLVQGAVAAVISHDKTKIKKYIFNDNIRFLNAYLNINGQRSLPVPKSFNRLKNDTEFQKIYDHIFFSKDDINKQTDKEEKKQFKGIEQGFIITDSKDIKYQKVSTVSDMHNYVINKNKLQGQRCEDKAVFNFSAIAKGQKFIGKLIFNNENDSTVFFEEFAGIDTIYLGKSKNAQYGRCRFSLDRPAPYQSETGSSCWMSADENIAVLTLLSDLVLLDNNANYTTVVNADLLNRELKNIGIKDEPVAEIKKRIIASGYVDGFNAHHGLPKTQFPVIVKGSVLLLKLKKNFTDQEIKIVEYAGLGSKKNEGYGRVAVNWDIHNNKDNPGYLIQQYSFRKITDESDEAGTKKWHQLKHLPGAWRNAVFTKKIEDHIIKKVYSLYQENKSAFKTRPSNTQLQGLRNCTAGNLNPDKVIEFLDKKPGKKAEKHGDWDVYIEGEKFAEFLKNRILNKNNFYDEIGMDYLAENDKDTFYPESMQKFIIILIKYIIKKRNHN